MATRIEIIEVGPRDGLQSERQFIPTSEKIAVIDALSESGIKHIQATSFVRPELVPQMSDAEAVCAGINRMDGVTYSGLVLNRHGVDRLAATGLEQADISFSVSDTHSRQNVNASTDIAFAECAAMIARARQLGLRVRVGLQCAFGTIMEPVPKELVIRFVKSLLEIGVDAIALADTAGMATPTQVRQLISSILDLTGDLPLILHLHDTRGLGLANVLVALELGVKSFDTAFGGLGGCNFLEGASGNIATEDTVNLIHSLGYVTGVNIGRVSKVSMRMERLLQRQLLGKMCRLDSTYGPPGRAAQ